MKRLDLVEFLREVLEQLDDLPEGLDQKLVEIAVTSPTTRWTKIRDLIEEAARG